MFTREAIFIFCIFYVLIDSNLATEVCTRLSACSCVLPNGEGYNLSALAVQNTLSTKKNSFDYYFQPCRDVYIKECNNKTEISFCLKDLSTNATVSTSLKDINLILENDQPVLKFHNGNLTNTTTISLVCCQNCPNTLTADSDPILGNHFLILESQDACKIQFFEPTTLSTGSVLMILFVLIIGTYFIGGAIALKLLRGATGWEMIPNHRFWCELPSLIRDGVSFAYNCCRPDSYERI